MLSSAFETELSAAERTSIAVAKELSQVETSVNFTKSKLEEVTKSSQGELTVGDRLRMSKL